MTETPPAAPGRRPKWHRSRARPAGSRPRRRARPAGSASAPSVLVIRRRRRARHGPEAVPGTLVPGTGRSGLGELHERGHDRLQADAALREAVLGAGRASLDGDPLQDAGILEL